MIRRIYVKSSVGYPEVVHRFCGYLDPPEGFPALELFSACQSARKFFAATAPPTPLVQPLDHTGDANGFGKAQSFPETSDPKRPGFCSESTQSSDPAPFPRSVRASLTAHPEHHMELPTARIAAAWGPVAQWLVQGTHNPLVAGSSPAGPTILQQDQPWSRSRHWNPHPVLTAGRLLTVQHLHGRLIEADVARSALPLVHQVHQRLQMVVDPWRASRESRLGRTRTPWWVHQSLG